MIVLGASGMLGRVLFELLECDGTHFSNPYKTTKLFTTDLLKGQDVVINCVCEKDVDKCEKDPDRARELNCDFVKTIVDNLSEDTFFVQISTDYVFDGTGDVCKPNPINVYGRTKLDGELHAMKHKHTAIIRVPVLYTEPVDIISSYTDLRSDKEFDGISIRYPTNTRDVARFIKTVIEQRRTGTFHYSANKSFTKHHIAESLNLPIECIKGSSGNRPIHAFLGPSDASDFSYDDWKIPRGNDIFIMLDLDGTLLDTVNIHKECYEKNPEDKMKLLKQIKRFDFIWDSEYMIDFVITNNINHVVLTNTSRETVDHFSEFVPKLKGLHFVTNNDYTYRKPNSNAYEVAMRCYKGEKHILVFDDLLENLEPMRKYTKLLFHMSNDRTSKDIYTLNSFEKLVRILNSSNNLGS